MSAFKIKLLAAESSEHEPHSAALISFLCSAQMSIRANKAAGVSDGRHVNTVYVRGQGRRITAVWTEGEISRAEAAERLHRY